MAVNPETSTDRYWKILVATSLVFCFFHLFLHSRAPTLDGDSFEYAGIARNLFQHGIFREDLLGSYTIKDQALPHQPSQRANLYSVALVPFYAVFRDTQWTFIIPTFIGLFLLPLVVYRVGKKLFSPETAFYAAVISLFSPPLLSLYTLMDPGLPEVWQMIFYLSFILAMAEERYALSGALMALAFLFKQNSVMLIPTTVIWLFLCRRKALFGVPTLKIFGVAFLLVLPFLMRSYIVFGSPVHNEQFEGVSRPYAGRMLDKFEKGDLFGIIFNYEEYNESPPLPHQAFGARASNFLKILRINMKMAFFGSRMSIFYMPGVFQTIGLLLVPFFIAGAYSARKRAHSSLMLILIFLQFTLHALMATYSDRYILCIMPLIWLFCSWGLVQFQDLISRTVPSLKKRSMAWSIVLFFILTEGGVFFAANTTRLFQSPNDNKVREIETACEYLRDKTGPDSVVMTYPFFSTHFICNRLTVPLPYGSVYTIAKVIKKYDARYLIFTKVWGGDLFMDLPFAATVARGASVSLFRIDRGKLADYLRNHASYPIDKINSVGYFMSNRFNMELSPPVYKIISKLTGSRITGFVLYLAFGLAFICFFSKRGFWWRAFAVAAASLLVAILSIFHFVTVLAPYSNAKPQLSFIQAKMVVGKLPEANRRTLAIPEPDAPSQGENNAEHQNLSAIEMERDRLVGEQVKTLFGKIVTARIGDILGSPSPVTTFIPVQPLTPFLSDEASFADNVQRQQARQREIEKIELEFGRRGFNTDPIYGGVFAYK
jgi:4-amino-4-deoxy-L-arabinose transferase-like glycosyltransferase